MRALVTGCAGFIGSHLAERLVALGHEVRGVDCFTDYYPRPIKQRNLGQLLEAPRFEMRTCDLAEDPLDGMLDGVDAVFHLAAQAGVRGSFGEGFAQYVRNNVVATQRLLEAAATDPVETFVYASSSAVYGDAEGYPTAEESERRPVSPYGMTKVATEEVAGVYHRTRGVPAVGLRYFTGYGPRQRPDMAFSRFVSSALEGRPIVVYGDGGQTRDFTFVADIVEATLAAAERGRPGSVYNVGGGTSVSIGEVVQLVGELVEREVAIDRRPAARGDARHTCANGGRAARELAFRPSVPLRIGLASQVDWMLDRARERPGRTTPQRTRERAPIAA